MRRWSTAPKPSAFAMSRACRRAITMSSSPTRTSATSLSTGRAQHPLARDQAAQQRQPPPRIEGRVHALQFQAEFDEGDRHGGLNPDDDGMGAEEAGPGGDVRQEPAEE